MKVEVSEGVVDAALGSSNVMKLHKLLGFACEGRHVILFDDQKSQRKCLDTFTTETRTIYAEALEYMYRLSAQLPADVATIRIDNIASESWSVPLAVLSLDQALSTLEEPLGIIVENAENDWCFLCGIMRTSERQRITQAQQRGWLRAYHGGGSTLQAEVQRRLSFPQQSLRTFVLFDSDRRHPGELAPEWSPAANEQCQGYTVQRELDPLLPGRYWMLKRRFIESYMPVDEMADAVSGNVHSDAIDAFSRMGQDARWYFNMKKGFNGDLAVENKHRCLNLYSDINDDDRNALNSGFGRSFADRYQEAVNVEFNWDQEARLEASSALPNLMRLL